MGTTIRRALTLLLLLAFMFFPAERGGSMETGSKGKDKGTVQKLPQPRLDGGMSVEKALRERRSIREYRRAPLTIAEVSQLLWAAQGITSPRGFRTAPSAGALYPLDAYLVAGDVEGLPAGVYHYQPADHALTMNLPGDLRSLLSGAALGQASLRSAPAVLVLAAVYDRTTRKYGKRGIRYVHMDAGHSAENIYLQATALGLGTVAVGAFDDAEVGKVLGFPKDEEPLYIMPVGRK